MDTKVRVEIARGYVMPDVCCACGAPAGASSLLETASDPDSRTMIAVHFPLCTACGHVERTVSGWKGKQGSRRCPPEMKERFQKIERAVRVSSYRPIAVRDTPTMTIRFANQTFARLFEKANPRPLKG